MLLKKNLVTAKIILNRFLETIMYLLTQKKRFNYNIELQEKESNKNNKVKVTDKFTTKTSK